MQWGEFNSGISKKIWLEAATWIPVGYQIRTLGRKGIKNLDVQFTGWPLGKL